MRGLVDELAKLQFHSTQLPLQCLKPLARHSQQLLLSRFFRLVTWHFVTDLMRQTQHNLWRDGALWRLATWRSAWASLFGHAGLVRCQWRAWCRYLDAGFHPSQGDGSLARQWLAAHAELVPPVSAPGRVPQEARLAAQS